MANTANPVTLALQELPPPPPMENTIMINGHKYKYTIFQGNQNITHTKDWKALADSVGTLFEECQKFSPAAPQKTIERVEMTLQGDFTDLAQPTLAEKDVTITSTKVRYKDTTDPTQPAFNEEEVKDKILSLTSPAVKTALKNVGKSFALIKPVGQAANPAAPQTFPDAPGFEEKEVDERVRICERRAVEIKTLPRADYALADQLISMDQSLLPYIYKNKPLADLAKLIREDVGSHIYKRVNGYYSGTKFESIFMSLNDAKARDAAALENARKEAKTFLGAEKIEAGRLDSLLNREVSSLDKNEKDLLVEIYLKYLEKGGRETGEAFINAFVEYFDKTACFQVTVIRNQNAISYFPTGETSISTKRCAFIHINDAGEFSSYDRKNPSDLNQNTILSTQPKRIKVGKLTETTGPTGIKVINVDATGQCLDKSVAYQILKKSNHALTQTNIDKFATQLREKAAVKMKEDIVLSDEMFIAQLDYSISAIPGEKPDDIKEILNTKDYTLENKRKLANFYSEYITKKNEFGEMKNYLDSAFLYVLPLIIVHDKCAVVQRGKIEAKYPTNAALNFNDWIFIEYNGTNHYYAVNTDDQATRAFIEAKIAEHPNEVLTQFKEMVDRTVDPTTPQTIKNKLLELKVDYPQAFNAIAGLMYDYEVSVFGEENVNPEGNLQYGEDQLNNLDPATLKARLQSQEFSLDNIRQKIATITV